MVDRILLSRIEQYSSNNELNDVEEVVEHLRRCYKEYQRHKLAPFRKLVADGVSRVLRKPKPQKPELVVQEALKDNAAPSNAPSSLTKSSEPCPQTDVASDALLLTPRAGVNSSMLSLYGRTSAMTGSRSGPGSPEAGIASARDGPRAMEHDGLATEPASAAQHLQVPQTASAQPSTALVPAATPHPSTTAAPTEPLGTPAPSTSKTAKRDGGVKRLASSKKKQRMMSEGIGPHAQGSYVAAARPITYADLGGVEGVLSDIRELIEYPLKHPEVYAWLGVDPPRGVLLHGPPGCGKTALAHAIANECGVPFLRVSAPEMVSGMSGESEAKLRGLFLEAASLAPCIVFIDEIDAIAPKRETAQREMERRIVAQMLTCMDDLGNRGQGDDADPSDDPSTSLPPSGRHVLVLGATNRPDALDAALRRAGRFDREISLGIPNEEARAKILQVITRRLRLAGDFDFHIVARKTPGFVGADLTALTKEAAAIAVTRIFSELEAQPPPTTAPLSMAMAHQNTLAAGDDGGGDGGAAMQCDNPPETTLRFGTGPLTIAELAGLAITAADFDAALHKVQPSVRREGFTTKPDVSWEDVGALAEVREELSFSISQPISHPERFLALGLSAAVGVLLYGPPGCGKTLVAKAVANESGANFISIKGPELLSKYVGESERAVRQLFSRARSAVPCVLFFDELDALAPRRGTDGNMAAERVVNQLLTEMDGMDGRQGVYVIAATNRPDMIDPALLRPGRLDKILYVPLPGPDGRASVLTALTRKTPLADDVNLASLSLDMRLTGFSGADLSSLVREAAVASLKESLRTGSSAEPCVHDRHFKLALGRVAPSVSKRDQKVYDALRNKLSSYRNHLADGDAETTAQPQAPASAATSSGPVAAHDGMGDAQLLMDLDSVAIAGGLQPRAIPHQDPPVDPGNYPGGDSGPAMTPA